MIPAMIRSDHHRTVFHRPGRNNFHPQLQSFIDASNDAILIVENSRVTAANQFACQLLGINIVGQNVRIAFRHAGAIERLTDPDAQHTGHPIRLTGIGQQGQMWDMRIQSIGPDQKMVHLADRSGAQAAEKMRVDFVANASHELLTPLAAVKGFIETLDDPAAGDDPETRGRFLGIMAKETDRMQALVRDLMSLSRIEAEKYDPPQSPVDFAQIVMETVDHLRSSQKERGSDIVVDITMDTSPVMGDAGQLRQLASNIITNAMKYGRPRHPCRRFPGAITFRRDAGIRRGRSRGRHRARTLTALDRTFLPRRFRPQPFDRGDRPWIKSGKTYCGSTPRASGNPQ